MKLLVVVDMQNDFINGSLGTHQAQAIVPGAIEYIHNFDGEVVYTQDTHGKDYLNTQEGKKLPVPHCIFGSEGWKIPEELMCYKKNYNEPAEVFGKGTFGSTKLAQYIQLNRELYEEITLIGLCTDICVISNALLIKAFCREIPIKVIADLCAGTTVEKHEMALEVMESCQIEIL